MDNPCPTITSNISSVGQLGAEVTVSFHNDVDVSARQFGQSAY